MSKEFMLAFLVVLVSLLLICDATSTTLTPTPIISVKLDCPGILNDVDVCRDCRIEDTWGITPEGCILVEYEE